MPTSLLRDGIGSMGRSCWTFQEPPLPAHTRPKSSMSTAICSQPPAPPTQPRVYSDRSTPFIVVASLTAWRSELNALRLLAQDSTSDPDHGVWRVTSAPNPISSQAGQAQISNHQHKSRPSH